ncbi:transcriptional regulator [Pseudomonas aeruginosa]|nr:transcriptional regulator [Pseudomonas aeruginosa]
MSIPRLPPLNAVRAFEAAARLGSYVAASKALHVTQPAVGRHVRLLEDWLGARLFERTSRGVRLTPAGRQYYAAVSAALQQIAEAGGQLGGARWLRIMAVPAFARRWLTPRLETLCAQRPGLKIALEPNPHLRPRGRAQRRPRHRLWPAGPVREPARTADPAPRSSRSARRPTWPRPGRWRRSSDWWSTS